MVEKVHSERNFGDSERLKASPPWKRFCRHVTWVLLGLCVMRGSARGQSAQTSVEAYAEAVKQSVISERIVAMERYLTLAGASRLKADALEFLIWDHLRLGHQTQAVPHARELLAIEPMNPLAIALVNQDSSSVQGKSAGQKRLAMLETTSASLDQLRRPEGMPERNFQMLRRQVAIMLEGLIGSGYLDIGDYLAARPRLQQAVDADPNNAQLVYGLALALLNGKNKDEYRGYWYLARAANLSEQTAQGRDIADYAQRTFHANGGTDAGWQAFVASAAALDAPPPPAGSPAQAASNTVASNTRNPNRPAEKPQTTQTPAKAAAATATGASAASKPSGKNDRKSKALSGFEATLREPERTSVSPEPSPKRAKVLAVPTQAVSLGILIETSLLTRQNRPVIISTLKEIVRNLRANDEACILVFSDQLDFEQDLTADDQLLEDALGQIRPKSGKALLSGISFAAGHLKRIGRNANRILLVISDGDSKPAAADTLSFRSQVTGVRIECVGLKAAGSTERTLLERIAAYSGGKASFASGPEEFRTATLQITRSIGIAIP
jgi:tetratricopeptide (TPR) repeat protein